MIRTIRQFFEEQLQTPSRETQEEHDHRLQRASAALLMELIHTDHHVDEREEREFAGILRDAMGLRDDEIQEITELARREARQATSLYEFTSLINDGYEYADKLELIANMWRIAWADGEIDKFEDNLIRRTAELIHVSHSDFIRLKLQVRDGQSH